jgi:hypothetical protein
MQIKEFKKYLREATSFIDKTKGSLHNSWRARVFTEKGKKIGFPEKWKTFKGFCDDVQEGWERGSILIRIDQSKPFSKENSKWAKKGDECYNKNIKIEHNGETKFIFEWCKEFGLNYNGVIQRYHRTKKQLSSDEVLFGIIKKQPKLIKDYRSLSGQNINNKLSKMLSSYRNSDIRKGLEFKMTRDDLFKIINQPCSYCNATENIGADRIDNSKGHVVENIIPCCYVCNVVRSNLFSVEEMKLIGKTIKLINKKRNE